MKAAALLVPLVVLAACRREAPRDAEAEPPVPVIAEAVQTGHIRATVGATGVVRTLPGASHLVYAPQAARLREITKHAGDPIASGETLVRVEFPSLRAQTAVHAAALRSAELRLQRAQAAHGRIAELLAKGAASRREMEDAERERAAAEAEFAGATAALAAVEAQGQDDTIRAPFDGVVAERLHNEGDLVRGDASDPILRLVDPKQVQVSATVAAADAARFAIGATARALADRQAAPERLRVVARSTPGAGAASVEVTLAFEAPTPLEPGTEVAVEIDAEERSDVPLVPAIAVLKDAAGGAYVMLASGGLAVRRPVTIGLVDVENIEILSGLKAGEQVITHGHSTLRDGTPISVSAP